MQISYAAAGVNDLHGPRLDDGKPLHKPAVLLWGKLNQGSRFPWPLKASALNTLVKQNETITLPEETFDPVPSSSTEQEQ